MVDYSDVPATDLLLKKTCIRTNMHSYDFQYITNKEVLLLVSTISEVSYCSASHVLELYGVPVYEREVSTIEGALIHTVVIVAFSTVIVC